MNAVDRRPSWTTWLRLWALATSPGVVLGLVIWGPEFVAAVALLPFVLGTVAHVLVLLFDEDPAESLLVRLKAVLFTGAIAASAAVALSALAAISASAALTATAVAGLTTPAGKHWIRQVVGVGGVGTRPGGGRGEQEPSGRRRSTLPALLSRPARDLSNAELCRAWRLSFTALHSTSVADETMRLVALRQSYLDEIEARDIWALQAWLAAGARAAGGPDRYLRDPGPGQPGTR